MIIFGTRPISSTKDRGEFFCPQCEGKKSFRRRRVRSFFHIYFIPLFPVSGGQDYVKCDACKGDFQVAVLDYDPEQALKQFDEAFHIAVEFVIVTMIAADSEIDPQEVDRAQQIVFEGTGIKIPADQIIASATEALDGRIPMDAALRDISQHVNEHGKELLIRVALDIAASDGEIVESEIELIERMAIALGMSAAHLNGIVMDRSNQPETEQDADFDSYAD